MISSQTETLRRKITLLTKRNESLKAKRQRTKMQIARMEQSTKLLSGFITSLHNA